MASRRESMLMIRITRLPEYTPVTGGDGAGAVELLDDDRAEDALIIAQKTLTTPSGIGKAGPGFPPHSQLAKLVRLSNSYIRSALTEQPL